MGGWMDGRESGVKDCLQQSKIVPLILKTIKFFYKLTGKLKCIRFYPKMH